MVTDGDLCFRLSTGLMPESSWYRPCWIAKPYTYLASVLYIVYPTTSGSRQMYTLWGKAFRMILNPVLKKKILSTINSINITYHNFPPNIIFMIAFYLRKSREGMKTLRREKLLNNVCCNWKVKARQHQECSRQYNGFICSWKWVILFQQMHGLQS